MKKVIAITIVCGLLFVMAIPCFATGAMDTVASNGNLIFSVGNTSCSIDAQITALTPYLNEIGMVGEDGEYYNINTSQYTFETDSSSVIFDIAQQFVFSVRIANKTSEAVYINDGYLRFDVTVDLPNQATFNRFYTGFELDELSGNLAGVLYALGNTSSSTTFPIAFRWNGSFTYDNGCIIPPKSVLNANVIFTVHTFNYIPGTTYDDAYNFVYNLMYSTNCGYQLNTLTLNRPTTGTLAPDGWYISNIDYNSILISQQLGRWDNKIDYLDDIYNQLVNVLNAINSQSNVNITTTNNYLTTTNNYLYTTNEYLDELRNYNFYLTGVYNNFDTNFDLSTNTVNNYNSHDTDLVTIDTFDTNLYDTYLDYFTDADIWDMNFSQGLVSGVGKVNTLFERLHNNLYEVRWVYLFPLILGVALMVIRHRPISFK